MVAKKRRQMGIGNIALSSHPNEDHHPTLSFQEKEDEEEEGTTNEQQEDYGFLPVEEAEADDDDIADGNCTKKRTTPNTTTTPPRRRPRRSSSLKHGSSYGDLEALIPLNFERKEYNRVLPIPAHYLLASSAAASASARQQPPRRTSSTNTLLRIASAPVLVRPVYLKEEEDVEEDDKVLPHKPPKRNISFGTLQIREHSVTMGDNPSVTTGTPIQLDWLSYDLAARPLFDDPEPETYIEDDTTNASRNNTAAGDTTPTTNQQQQQQQKRAPSSPQYTPSVVASSPGDFVLSKAHRQRLLQQQGYTQREIHRTQKQMEKIKYQREVTKFVATQYPLVHDLEDFVESTTRKVKRAFSGG